MMSCGFVCQEMLKEIEPIAPWLRDLIGKDCPCSPMVNEFCTCGCCTNTKGKEVNDSACLKSHFGRGLGIFCLTSIQPGFRDIRFTALELEMWSSSIWPQMAMMARLSRFPRFTDFPGFQLFNFSGLVI